MHDGSEDPIGIEPDYYEQDDDPVLGGHRSHRFKIRRDGFRELLLSKGWYMKGAYAEKMIQGRSCVISGRGSDHPDYYVATICTKEPRRLI